MILVVENKESAYTIADRPRTVVIHSLGNHLNILSEIGWLDSARQMYWGDLDRAGFTLLSRARARLPSIVSVLMDPVTLAEHKTLAVRDETRVDSPDPNLTDVEAAALAALSAEDGTYMRLEQERLPSPFVLSRRSTAMEADDPDPVPAEYRRDYAEIDFSDDEPTISTVRHPGPAAVQPIAAVSD